MSITHHLDDATLMSFAAGALPAALAAVAAAHVTMCARCRSDVVTLEGVGAALLTALPGARIERAEPEIAAGLSPSQQRGEASAAPMQSPAPLARLLPLGLDAVRWRRLGLGLWHHRLPLKGNGALGLLRVAPGRIVPEHGHGGAELTLVLRGSFRDATGRYRTGDVADLDDSIEHEPVADPGPDCVCLFASETPARFRGLIARLMQPWHGL